jgi:hypothetical protein
MTLYELLKRYEMPIIEAVVGGALLFGGSVLTHDFNKKRDELMLERDVRLPVAASYFNAGSVEEKRCIVQDKRFLEQIVTYDSLSNIIKKQHPTEYDLLNFVGGFVLILSLAHGRVIMEENSGKKR